MHYISRQMHKCTNIYQRCEEIISIFILWDVGLFPVCTLPIASCRSCDAKYNDEGKKGREKSHSLMNHPSSVLLTSRKKKRPHLTSASALLYFTGVDLVHCMATVNKSHCKIILSDIIGPTVKQFSPDESLSIFQDDSSCTHSGHWMDWWVWKQWKPARTS